MACNGVKKQNNLKGGSPGLVVVGRDSRSESHGFESWHRILDGYFFTYICCKNCIVCLKSTKINDNNFNFDLGSQMHNRH